MKKYWPVYLLIIISLIIRLILAVLPGLTFDVNDWFAWTLNLQQTNFSHFYSSTSFSDYLPGYMYILKLAGVINSILHLSSTQLYYLLKLPAIICETILAGLVFRLTKQKSSNKFAYFSFALIAFNPAFIFDSSIWGQIDGVLSLGLFLSIYYLDKQKLISSSIWAAIAFLIKPQTIFLFPVFLLFFLKDFNLRTFLKLALPFLIAVFVLSWPFYGLNVFPNIIGQVQSASKEYPYTSLFAYNLWGVVGFWLSDSIKFFGVNYQMIGLGLYALFWIITAYLHFKKPFSVYSLAALAFLSFYFLLTRVHDRYLYPAFIFLVILIPQINDALLVYFLGLLTLTFLANLYYVYIYYNHFYSHLPSLIYNQFIYQILDQNPKWLSLFSCLIFLIISVIIINNHRSAVKQKS